MLKAESFLHRYFRLYHYSVYLPTGNNFRYNVIHKKDAVAFPHQRQPHDRIKKREGVFAAFFAAGKNTHIFFLPLVFAVGRQAEPAGRDAGKGHVERFMDISTGIIQVYALQQVIKLNPEDVVVR